MGFRQSTVVLRWDNDEANWVTDANGAKRIGINLILEDLAEKGWEVVSVVPSFARGGMVGGFAPVVSNIQTWTGLEQMILFAIKRD